MNHDVFISYCHEDKKWLDRLQKMLKPLLRNNPISVWDDTRIRAGSKWKEEIEKALVNADVAVFLVSPNFLASDFITDQEIPRLLESAQSKGLRVLWVLISDCLWSETEIANYQAVHSPDSPLDSLAESDVNKALVSVCREIKRTLSPEPEPPPETANRSKRNLNETLPPRLPPPLAQLGGTWRSMDGSSTIIRQNGTQIAAESFVTVFGIATKAAWGQGTIFGKQAQFDFMDMYGNGGRSEITLSDDGQSLSGVARYHNGFVQSMFATRSV